MKLFKRFSTAKQRKEASDLLCNIAEQTSLKESAYYQTQLLPSHQKRGYDYETYLKLLRAVKYQIDTGQRERKEPQTIVATARNKVLT